MQNIFTSIKCSEIILYNANENWYIILYDLFSRLCYIATCGPFCKDATQYSLVTGGREPVASRSRSPPLNWLPHNEDIIALYHKEFYFFRKTFGMS